MTPENLREFEKAPKSLVKMTGKEVLFADDAVGKMQYIYAAFEDRAALEAAAAEVLASEDGARHLIRALNNIKKIAHKPAMTFAEVVYRTVLPELDLLARVQKCQQILDAIDETYDADFPWLDEEVTTLLNILVDDASTQVVLWSAWVGANLRSIAQSDKLIRVQAPCRLKVLSKTVFNQLVRTMNDAEELWTYRAAAMYALIGANAMSLADAQDFMDAAYSCFPLEALSGIEALSMALELDAAAFAEQNAIAEKLAQVRHDHLILRDMSRDDFVAAAENLFSHQNDIAEQAIDIALSLQSLEKNDRMMTTILIDDARRADFIQMAIKFQALRALSNTFFAHFNAGNAACRALSQSIVMALTEVVNLDARLADDWMNACDAENVESLNKLAAQINV